MRRCGAETQQWCVDFPDSAIIFALLITIVIQSSAPEFNRRAQVILFARFRHELAGDGNKFALLISGVLNVQVLHRFPYSGVMFMSHERFKDLFESSGYSMAFRFLNVCSSS